MVDMQGRLQGKRLTAEHFLDVVLERKAEGCNYQLAIDIEMNPVAGYRHASWSTGYGDFVFAPDRSTLRRLPWLEGTALVMCDLEWEDGTPVVVSPRQVLRRQIERLGGRDLVAMAGTELEFIVFQDTYEEAWERGYRDLIPATRYNVDYSLLDTSGLEPLMRAIRNGMRGAAFKVENSKGECNRGQHEINFLYQPALETADLHAIYKNGAKEIAAQHGCSLTFMAKYDEREGNSCHIHLSVRNRRGEPVMADGHELSALGRHFMAGLLAGMADLTLFFAPNINSYKRFAKGSFAPTTLVWGRDNRTCAVRLIGHDSSLRVENRVPGGDVNPYLALAAMIAAGLHGIENELPLEEACIGNAYEVDGPQVPATLRDARERFAASPIARAAFGEEVVEHYLNMARIELDAFDAAVTDWERFRSFERM
ncbi:MAG: glutamine synthetase [Gammaproteobacteria bacterium]|nr:glutamine synthetase [Gammaproteobacteria bacterium]NIR84128.1 glutamine synthetase [Gammaproteobacteria bacterium]NIR89440.1 glutamine synthetase [Gammaproteobacteria bacterium]NIU05283.1 glutamine synthetase [Gammaproteobacteria bacterium]NIV52223.1 glutamine synthetase [Gammaproteobacteria bacterium]